MRVNIDRIYEKQILKSIVFREEKAGSEKKNRELMHNTENRKHDNRTSFISNGKDILFVVNILMYITYSVKIAIIYFKITDLTPYL